jgi:hypothetical protein
METPVILPTWAPRVKPYLLRRLYESDAKGLCDDELLDEVGWKLYVRCGSFIEAMQATQGRARCPVCQALISHTFKAKEILLCPACGWQCAWKIFYKTIQNQQLNGGPEVVALFQNFLDKFPQAGDYHEKMLLIDGLIHGFHHYLSSGRTRRPAGINLIDGSLEFVTRFLDELTYGPASTTGLQQNHLEWQNKVQHRALSGAKKTTK